MSERLYFFNRRICKYSGTLDSPEDQKLGWGIDFSNGIQWADLTVGGGVGVGWSDTNGSNTTAIQVVGEFLAKVIGEDQNPKGAGYVGGYGSFKKTGDDATDESVAQVGVKFSYFDPITKFNEVQLIYGAKAFYETGSVEFSASKEDISGIGLCGYTGVNFKVNNVWSLGIEVPVATYRSRTFKANGSEFKSNTVTALVNLDNPITATMRFHLGTSISDYKDTDGDGVEDIDDACPKKPGIQELNGCPDSDGDGVVDSKDSCPEVFGSIENNGCPNKN